ncbi:hypothetical protein [Janthinobacterium psychrotolerans]|uniref:Uncharacterized protein n=1 Tax=Janthinobacterium psychrotolerans TaxID=1747903 RepID=A0A1A7BTR9_9BURK|nr:hypothetical protein [Janthinobacterium psychrotolerans]OBV36941.1 hypothetical protein ASR47_1001419 [Janthinobacterium psychrotolerans]
MMEALDNISWFRAAGTFQAQPGQLALPSLHAWDSASMDWLPTSRGQPDPVHGDALPTLLKQAGTPYLQAVMANYKLALHSLRCVPDRLISKGAHDFTPAAIGAALYCVRMASLEMLAQREGFWLAALDLYRQGHWPCGLVADGTLVVY